MEVFIDEDALSFQKSVGVRQIFFTNINAADLFDMDQCDRQYKVFKLNLFKMSLLQEQQQIFPGCKSPAIISSLNWPIKNKACLPAFPHFYLSVD